jgi:hypothetical protein
MAQLPLKTRRGLARGFNRRNVRVWNGRKTIGDGNRAFLTTNLAGTNNDLRYMAKAYGTAGNAVTVTYAVAGNNTPLSVSVAGSAITVNVATNGSAAPLSTALDVCRAVLANRQANALVSVWAAPQNDGTGVVAAMAATALSGGTTSPRV